MPNGTAEHIADLISTPLEELLVALGSGIGRSQAALDRHSIEIQRLIAEDPVLAQYGLEATWYQIPTTQLELKIAVAMEEPAAQPPTQPPIVEGFLRRLPRIWAQPVNARYTNQFAYDIQAASTVTLSVVAVPPPGAATAVRPTKDEAEVLSLATPHLFVDASGTPTPRITINFNPGARAWFVVQTDETQDPPTLRSLVRIDDATGAVLGHTGGPA
jgi:hypothetical protein